METSAWLDDYNGYWIRYAVRFSDFKAGALLPADEGLYSSTTTESSKPKNVQASTVQNGSNSTITATQSTSKTVSETLSSTVNHSSSYSFSEGVELGVEGTALGMYKVSAAMSVQLGQAFTDGWSKTDTKTASTTTNSNENAHIRLVKFQREERPLPAGI